MIPTLIFEAIKRLQGEHRTGQIVLHMKDGQILVGEFKSKEKLGKCEGEVDPLPIS